LHSDLSVRWDTNVAMLALLHVDLGRDMFSNHFSGNQYNVKIMSTILVQQIVTSLDNFHQTEAYWSLYPSSTAAV
jgi:hypothetical protein